MIIVGVSALYHDSACAIVVDGRLAAAAQEERFTRRRFDQAMPVYAFAHCLRHAGVSIHDIDCVAYYEEPQKKLERQLWMGLPQVPPVRREALFRLDATRPLREIRNLLGYSGKVLTTGHHEAHAASAFYCSGFEDAALLTIDAVGEWATTTYGRGNAQGIQMLEEVRFPHSLGLLYATLTAYLGFQVNSDEYKVMGLAPYGQPTYLEKLRNLVEDLPGGQFRLDGRYFDFATSDPARRASTAPTTSCSNWSAHASLTAVLPHLATWARVVVIGVGAGGRMELDLLQLMVKRVRIGASTLRSRSRQEKADVAAAVAAHVLPLLAAGRLTVPICDTFPWPRRTPPTSASASGAKLGKVVLVT